MLSSYLLLQERNTCQTYNSGSVEHSVEGLQEPVWASMGDSTKRQNGRRWRGLELGCMRVAEGLGVAREAVDGERCIEGDIHRTYCIHGINRYTRRSFARPEAIREGEMLSNRYFTRLLLGNFPRLQPVKTWAYVWPFPSEYLPKHPTNPCK